MKPLNHTEVTLFAGGEMFRTPVSGHSSHPFVRNIALSNVWLLFPPQPRRRLRLDPTVQSFSFHRDNHRRCIRIRRLLL